MIQKIKTQSIASSFAFVKASNATINGTKYASAYYTCDGTDDNIQIQDALNNYSTVVLSDGTFNLAATLTGTSSLIGQGDDTIINQGSLDTAISFGNSSTQIDTATAISVNTITTTIDLTSSLTAGDYIMISSTDLWHNLRGAYTNGEVLQVESVTATTITTTTNVWLTYTNLPRIYKYNLSTLKLQGFKVVYGSAVSTSMVNINNGFNCLVSQVTIDGNANASRGITLSNCVNSKIQNCVAENVGDVAFVGFQIGYGIYLSGCTDSIIVECSGKNNKHFIDMDKSNYQAINTNTQIINCTNAGNSIREPFTCHGGSYNTQFINCKHTITLADANNGEGIGFLLRGVKSTMNSCEVSGVISNSYVEAAINVGESVQQGGTGINGDGRSGEDLLIDSCIVNLTRNTGVFTSSSNGHFIDMFTGANNATITNNTFIGLQNDGILLDGNDNQNIVINNNSFDFSGHRAGEFIVNIAPKDASNTNGVTFNNNTIQDAVDTTPPYVKGTITNYTQLNNTII